MSTGLEKLDALRWRLTVDLPTEQLEQRAEAQLDELRRSARIPGFRPGKVPIAQLRHRFGDRVVRDQAERLAQAEVRAALAAHGLRPVTAPELSFEGLPSMAKPATSATPKVVATFEVFPALPVIDLAKLRIELPKVTVGEADVEHMISRLLAEKGAPTELNASLVRSFGFADGKPETLRCHLAETMENELSEALEAERIFLVEQALVSLAPELELPPALLTAQVQRLRDTIAEASDLGPGVIEARARRLLATSFLIAEVARQRGLVPDATQLWDRTRELADCAEDPSAELDRIWGNGELVQEIEEKLLRQQVTAAVLAEARVSEVRISFRELAERRRDRLEET